MLGLDDVDLGAGVIHVRAQLSRAHRGAPAQRVAPKTPASVRDVPLVAQLARQLSVHRQQSRFARGGDWVFATARGTPTATATSAVAASGAPPGAPGSTMTAGRRFASTTCATPSRAT
jgi:hypothetical protein